MKLKFLFFPAALICLLSFSAQAQEKSKIRCIEGAGNNRYTYEKWLERDALYIITPEEKRAFLDLKTDAEREQFVELFWRRRDPNPETEINEFKEAYYERIAYANEHLSSVAAAGWKTDRGRIYIIYGKPDSVATGFDEKETKAWIEEWHYRYLDAIGGEFKVVFVDVKSDGNFRLRNDAPLIFR
jgi:GWxTD domain-containing protein